MFRAERVLSCTRPLIGAQASPGGCASRSRAPDRVQPTASGAPPAAIGVDQVLERALRHLAWQSRDDLAACQAGTTCWPGTSLSRFGLSGDRRRAFPTVGSRRPWTVTGTAAVRRERVAGRP